MSDKETGLSRVSSMREVQALLYEYREEDIQIPYLLAECVDYLIAENDQLRAELKRISTVENKAVRNHIQSAITSFNAALQEEREDD